MSVVDVLDEIAHLFERQLELPLILIDPSAVDDKADPLKVLDLLVRELLGALEERKGAPSKRNEG